MPPGSIFPDLDGVLALDVSSCFTFFLFFWCFSRQLAAFASRCHRTLKEAEWLGNPESVCNRLMCEISESKLLCLTNTRNRAYCCCLYGQVCVFTGRLVDADLQRIFTKFQPPASEAAPGFKTWITAHSFHRSLFKVVTLQVQPVGPSTHSWHFHPFACKNVPTWIQRWQEPFL